MAELGPWGVVPQCLNVVDMWWGGRVIMAADPVFVWSRTHDMSAAGQKSELARHKP